MTSGVPSTKRTWARVMPGLELVHHLLGDDITLLDIELVDRNREAGAERQPWRTTQ